MKSKVNNETCAHVWANYEPGNMIAADYSANCEGNSMSTSGQEAQYLYSYGTCIGERLKVKGETVYLVSDTSYSVTTSKHQGYMLRAIPCGYVFPIDGEWGEKALAGWNYDKNKLRNRLIDLYIKRAGELSVSAKRRRSPEAAAWDIERANEYLKMARQVKSLFGSRRKIPEDLEQMAADIEKARKAKAKKEKALKAKREREARENIIRWKAGENVNLPYGIDVCLRVQGDKIQTSRQAYISIDEARVAYKAWKAGNLEPRDQVGGFSYVHTTGKNVVIGCHTIPIVEIERIATELEWS